VKKRFVKDLAAYAPSQFLPALTAFITTPILTRLLAPAEYGYWAQASSVAGFLVALAASGLGSAVLRFYPAYEARSAVDIFFATFGVSAAAVVTVVAGLSLLLVFLLRELLPSWLVQLFPLVILIFITQSIFTVFITVIRSQGRSGSVTAIQLLTSYGSLGVGLLMVASLGFGVAGLLWGTILIFTLMLPFLLVTATRGVGIHPRRFQLREAVKIWEYAWPLTLGNVAMWGLRVSDLFVISSFWPARNVGLYSVSYNISSKSIDLLVTSFLLGVSPLVYRTWETEGREATETTMTMVTRIYLIMCLPVAVGLSILAFPFVALLTAPEYHEGSRIVYLVVFSSFVLGLANIAMLCLAIKQQARRLGGIQIIAAAIHIGLQLLLVPRFGYVASAICSLIGYTALLLLLVWAARAHLSWRFPFTTLRNVIAASAVMGLAAWGVYGMSKGGSQVSPAYLLLSVAVAVPTYGLCLWWLGEIDDAERATVVTLWARVIGR
jgi:O-antigen/teichoic acid export membrane protein